MSGGSDSPAQTTQQQHPAKPQVRPQVRTQTKTQAKKQRKKDKARESRNQTQAQVWVEGLTDDGHTYYYNTITGGGDNLKNNFFFIQICIFILFGQTDSFQHGCGVMLSFILTTESRWDNPEGFQGDSLALAQLGQTEVNLYIFLVSVHFWYINFILN